MLDDAQLAQNASLHPFAQWLQDVQEELLLDPVPPHTVLQAQAEKYEVSQAPFDLHLVLGQAGLTLL